MKCPHCGGNIDVQFIKAPADSQPSRQNSSNHATSSQASISSIGALLDAIEAEGAELDAAATKFVEETRERWDKYGQRIKFSDKQLAWLERIANGENRRDSW